MRLGDSMFHAPVWAEPIAVFIKLCFTDWLQNLQDTLLYQAVIHCGDSKRPCFVAPFFWDFYPFYCFWLVILKFTLDNLHELAYFDSLNIFDIHIVCTIRFTPGIVFDVPIRKFYIVFTSDILH